MWILATGVGLGVEVATIVLLGRSVTRRDDAGTAPLVAGRADRGPGPGGVG